MIKKFIIKPAFINDAHYVSQYNENDVILKPINDAKHFSTKQDAINYLKGFPYLTREDGINVNSFIINTIYIIEKN